VGPWARALQSGLKSFLAGRLNTATWAYTRAAEMGYRTATYNVAWLHRNALAEARAKQLVKGNVTGGSLENVSSIDRVLLVRGTLFCASRWFIEIGSH